MDASLNDEEKRFILAEMIKSSKVDVLMLANGLRGIVEPDWMAMLLPHGRNMTQCIKAAEDMFGAPMAAPQLKRKSTTGGNASEPVDRPAAKRPNLSKSANAVSPLPPHVPTPMRPSAAGNGYGPNVSTTAQGLPHLLLHSQSHVPLPTLAVSLPALDSLGQHQIHQLHKQLQPAHEQTHLQSPQQPPQQPPQRGSQQQHQQQLQPQQQANYPQLQQSPPPPPPSQHLTSQPHLQAGPHRRNPEAAKKRGRPSRVGRQQPHQLRTILPQQSLTVASPTQRLILPASGNEAGTVGSPVGPPVSPATPGPPGPLYGTLVSSARADSPSRRQVNPTGPMSQGGLTGGGTCLTRLLHTVVSPPAERVGGNSTANSTVQAKVMSVTVERSTGAPLGVIRNPDQDANLTPSPRPVEPPPMDGRYRRNGYPASPRAESGVVGNDDPPTTLPPLVKREMVAGSQAPLIGKPHEPLIHPT